LPYPFIDPPLFPGGRPTPCGYFRSLLPASRKPGINLPINLEFNPDLAAYFLVSQILSRVKTKIPMALIHFPCFSPELKIVFGEKSG